jgi:hypothetical protein
MNKYVFYINLILTLGLLPTHLWLGPPQSRLSRKALFGMILCWLIYWVYIGFQRGVSLGDVMLALGSYSAALFVFLSEILMTGGAARLTDKRGPKWTKEIDYVYLVLGAFGLDCLPWPIRYRLRQVRHTQRPRAVFGRDCVCLESD